MNCIFLCRIWKIENIQTVKTVPCSQLRVPWPNRQIFQQALITYPICNSPVHVRQNIEYGNGNL
ncbi:MAG: hypothetical protein RLZZ184_1918 [Cyanobacteriota bacterium]|jgi:hypothetical protein